MEEQEIVDQVLYFRDKVKDITNRIEYMEDIIDKTIEHNVGAKMRIQMDSFPLKQEIDKNRYTREEAIRNGEEDDETHRDTQTPSKDELRKIAGNLGLGSGKITWFTQGTKFVNSGQHVSVKPIDITLDESEVILMVGAILNLTRTRKVILEREYRKLVSKLQL